MSSALTWQERAEETLFRGIKCSLFLRVFRYLLLGWVFVDGATGALAMHLQKA